MVKKTAKKRTSFRLRRREKSGAPKLTSVRTLTRESLSVLKKEWKLFGGIGLLYVVCYRLFVEGLARLDFNNLQKAMDQNMSIGDRAVDALVTTGSSLGSTNDVTTDSSYFASGLTIIFSLAVVWGLRQVLAGRTVRIRDALYNCMSPFISVVIILFVIFLQTIPLAIGVFIYVAATATGVVNSGVENMTLFLVASLLALLSCYWLSSSIIGLMAATLPGIYPLAALKAAKELVADRRWQIFMRIAVFAMLVIVLWLVVIVAMVSNSFTYLFRSEIIALLRGSTLVVTTVFLYKLYRSLVDETAA